MLQSYFRARVERGLPCLSSGKDCPSNAGVVGSIPGLGTKINVINLFNIHQSDRY